MRRLRSFAVYAAQDDVPPGTITAQHGGMWTIIIILLVLWLLGLISKYTLGGFLHILLIIAIILVIVRLATGRRVI